MNASAPGFLQQLRHGRYQELDGALNDLQRGFAQRDVSEQDLQSAFQAFDVGDTGLGEAFGDWLEACIGSYAAHVALATWLHRRARDLRGGATANLVSDQGRRGMLHHLQQAEGAARHAAGLTGNPLSAWLIVGNVHNAYGCEVSVEEIQAQAYPDWYAEPLKDNPHSLALRRTMLSHLRTEWGGSEEHMLAFVRQQQDSGLLGQADVQRLWGRYHANVAHYEWLFKKAYAKALEHARLAADLNETHAELLFALLTDRNHPAAERSAALERFLGALERHPDHGLWHGQSALMGKTDILGPYAQRLGAVLWRMAEAGDADAATVLGVLRQDAPQLNLPDPRPLLIQARERGDVSAATLLIVLADKDRTLNAAQKREVVLKAADIGSEVAAWEVYARFDAYRKQFGLDDRARYRYLLRAADAGDNDARFALAQQLRGGFVEVGDDGVLRPVDTPPLQGSLDYARHLLERAAAEEHKGAQKALKAAKPAAWDAKTARRITVSGVVTEREASRGGRPWWHYWLVVSVVIGVIRGCASLTGGG